MATAGGDGAQMPLDEGHTPSFIKKTAQFLSSDRMIVTSRTLVRREHFSSDNPDDYLS